MNIITFENNTECHYPVGEFFYLNTLYVNKVSEILINNISSDKIITLVCRGTSGCIIAGAVGQLLSNLNRKVVIIISRKDQDNHSYNMDGHEDINESNTIVVIDDFITTGKTITKILMDLDMCVKSDVYPYLCVCNSYDSFLSRTDNDSIRIRREKILERFNTIICNK